MVLRRVALAHSALFLVAADEPPPLPAALEAYVAEGRFKPGDFGWMRGRLADASEQDRSDSRAIGLWTAQCIEQAKTEMRHELAELGYPDAKLETALVGPLVCRQSLPPNLPGTLTYPELARAVETAAPVAEAFLMAVRMAEEVGGPRGPTLTDELMARPLGEQMIRLATSWGEGTAAADAPELDPVVREIVRAYLRAAMAERDTANTEWLKDVIAREGWPRKSAVGEKAALEAWLLVQHADHDPVFQLRALRLMEPLVAEGEVEAREFGYLTDRVLLKLTGRQRYGTQFTCVAGRFAPQPIEDEAAVEGLRREARMETLAENTARMEASYGRC